MPTRARAYMSCAAAAGAAAAAAGTCAQHAEKLGAGRLVLVGASEWARGNVVVKDLAKFEQKEVAVGELVVGGSGAGRGVAPQQATAAAAAAPAAP